MRLRLTMVAFLAACALYGCNFTTAHLTNLTVAKDKAMTTPTASFASNDTVYARVAVANTPSKVTVQWHLIAEKVTGQKPNFAIPALDLSYDLPSDGTSDYTLTPPTAGWPTGTYKIVADMISNGATKDEKSVEFTVH